MVVFKMNSSRIGELVPGEFKDSSKPEVEVNEIEVTVNVDGEERVHREFTEEPTGKQVQMVWAEYCEPWTNPDALDVVELTPRHDITDQLDLWNDFFE